MSVKMALAKLSATAAGGALLAGGAVHVAETPSADGMHIKSAKSVKSEPVKYVKERRAERRIPKTVQRKRRIVRRVVECKPVGPAGTVLHGGGRVIEGSDQCAPTYRMAYAAVPVPLPQLPPIQGGSSGGVTVIGG
jgi:hypothetical protein